MNNSGLKNIVFLKDISSNIVDEAIIILKPNVKIKESVIQGINSKKNTDKGDYILNEAQLIVSNYVSKMKNVDENVLNKCKKKLKNVRILNTFLFIVSIIMLFVILF